MLLGLAKGKVGDLVFYRDGGEQRTRTRVIPKNPRTPAQMAQRVKIANASALYRTIAAVLFDSFPSRPSNQSGYNAFSSAAISLAPYMTKQQASSACVLPQPAIVSKGTLSTIEYSGYNGGEDAATALAIKGQFEADASLDQVFDAIVSQYPSIKNGDELTFVSVSFDAVEGVDIDDKVYSAVAYINNVKVDLDADDALSSIGLVFQGNTLSDAKMVADWTDGIALQAIIHSRVDGNGQLQVSTQWARLSPGALSLYEGYRDEAAKERAIESYMVSGEPVLR